MREHLYKAKRKDNGKWVGGYYWCIDEHYLGTDLNGKHFIKSINNGIDYEVIPETICEYTGLKDKNGTKIFEGDIVAGTITSQWNKRLIHCEVVFENGCFISVETDGHHWVHKLKFAKDIEVIGNKFDNPELLEVQDEQAN